MLKECQHVQLQQDIIVYPGILFTNLILQASSLLEAVDPAVPDAVRDGWEDDRLALVGLDRKPEVPRQLAFIDPTHETQVDDAVQKTLKVNWKF